MRVSYSTHSNHSYNPHPEVKLNVHVLAKSARVVIPVCPSIAECFQNRVGLDEPVSNPIHLTHMTTALSDVLEHVFGGLYSECSV